MLRYCVWILWVVLIGSLVDVHGKAVQSYPSLTPHCSECSYLPLLSVKSVAPGPCRSELFPSLCYDYNSLDRCPTGSAPCGSADSIHLPTFDIPSTVILRNFLETTIRLDVGSTIVWTPTLSSYAICLKKSVNSSCFAYSGVLNSTETFWFTFSNTGMFHVFDLLNTSASGLVLVSKPSTTTTLSHLSHNATSWPPLYEVFFYFHSMAFFRLDTEAAQKEFKNSILAALFFHLPYGHNSTIVNATISTTASGTVQAVVLFNNINASQAAYNIASSIVLNFAGINYTASAVAADLPPPPTAPSKSSNSPAAIIAGGVVGGLVVVILVILVSTKRRKIHVLTPPSESELEELPSPHEFDAAGFAGIHYAIGHGNFDLVKTWITRDTSKPPSPAHVLDTDSSLTPPSGDHVPIHDNPSEEEDSEDVLLVDLPASKGLYPLTIAILCDQPNIVKLLLDAHCGMTMTSSRGQNALHIVCISGASSEIMQLLLDANRDGSFVNMRDVDLATPLWYACLSGSVPLVQALVGAGADKNIPDIRGMTPLMVAVSRGHAGVTAELLQHGAVRVNDKNVQGWTALHWAAAVSDEKCLSELLRSRRVRVAVHNCRDETPLHLAAREGSMAIVEALLRGQKIEVLRALLPATAIDGHTAAELARMRGFENVALFLEQTVAQLVPAEDGSALLEEDVLDLDCPDFDESISDEETDVASSRDEGNPRRARMRKYMRARRRENKEQELFWTTRVDKLGADHEMMSKLLTAMRAEAMELRALLASVKPTRQPVSKVLCAETNLLSNPVTINFVPESLIV